MSQNLNSNGDQVADALMSTLTTELPPDAALVAVPASRAQGLTITSPEDRSVCSALLGDVKGKIKAIEEDRKRLTRPLDALKRMIMDKYRPALTFFEGEKDIYEHKLTHWDAAQAAIRAEEEARVRAETERIRQAEIAEAQKAEALEREKAAQLRREAEAEKDAARQEQMRQEAAERERQAQEESAARVEQALMISTAYAGPAVAHIGGESQSWKYSSEIIDFDTVIQAVAAGRLPKKVLAFNTTGARQLAEGTGDDFPKLYPEATCGLRLVKTPVYSHRQKRS